MRFQLKVSGYVWVDAVDEDEAFTVPLAEVLENIQDVEYAIVAVDDDYEEQ